MPRQGQRDSDKERFWRRMLRQWQRSGLSIRAFCRKHNLAEPSFYAWRRTFADAPPRSPRANSSKYL
jgi:transposase-like protein